LAAGRALAAPAEAGLIVRQQNPNNLESPFSRLDSFLTPNELFYIRSHFMVPAVDPATWRLKVEGAVGRELELTYDDLRRLPPRTVVATLECAGNGRSFLVPKAKGIPWTLGAVGNAEWTGVPLNLVLQQASLSLAAVEVVLEGADFGEIPAEARPAGTVHFARSLTLAKARRPEVLLAYQMNGKDLTAAHGFPVRAIVPGWYGVASVKSLQRLVVRTTPFRGFFQTMDDSTFRTDQGLAQIVPITELQVKSQIAHPTDKEVVPAGKTYKVRGTAWTGEADVVRVEVSTDGGRTWADATFRDRQVPYAWRLWEYAWKP
jgi:DMSO/TMAO reductase YedYZ molybdopterin-dependent catalytic subunit